MVDVVVAGEKVSSSRSEVFLGDWKKELSLKAFRPTKFTAGHAC